MGAWSFESFGNDTACDWAGDFVEEPSIDKISSAIEIVNNCDDYLESDQACECIVACEVIARLIGHGGVVDSYSEGVDAWVRVNKITVEKQLILSAVRSLNRIMQDKSELNELWQDSDEYDSWRNAVVNLIQRVGM